MLRRSTISFFPPHLSRCAQHLPLKGKTWNVRAAGFRSPHAACGISRNISRPWTYRVLGHIARAAHIASLDVSRAALFCILFLAKGKEKQRPLFFHSPLRPTPYSSVGTAFFASPPFRAFPQFRIFPYAFCTTFLPEVLVKTLNLALRLGFLPNQIVFFI